MQLHLRKKSRLTNSWHIFPEYAVSYGSILKSGFFERWRAILKSLCLLAAIFALAEADLAIREVAKLTKAAA